MKIFKLFNKWVQHPIVFYITIIIVMIIIALGIDLIFLNWDKSDSKNVWINIHASIVEVFLLGLFITKFNSLTEKKRTIQRWIEEIDDYRFWKEPEASYRNRGLIKRLNKAKITKIELYACNLKEAELSNSDLSKSDMKGTNLNNAILSGANLCEANLNYADLSNSTLRWADLSKANLSDADLKGADLYEANLSCTDLNATLVNENWFEKLKEWNCIGAEEIGRKYFISLEMECGETVYRLRKRKTQENKTE